jgi:glycosyltransferase involved in cell wall biosynthesis
MKVLIVFAHAAPYKVNLFNLLAKHVDLSVIFEREIPSYRSMYFYQNKEYAFNHVKIQGFNLGKENHLSWGIINHLKKHQYDLIIMNGYSSLTEMLTIHYLIQHRIPYVIYVNGGVIRNDPAWKFKLKHYLVSHAQAYLAPTPIVDEYLMHYGANLKNIYHYAYATIFESDILKKPLSIKQKQSMRDEYHLPPGKLFISVGQFIKRKNFDQLLSLWAEEKISHGLVLVGDGEEKKSLIHQAKKLQLNNIHWIPFLPKTQLLHLLSAMDCFILLSKEDIYGHVINEAHSQGLPVIASDRIISGQNLIHDGQNGFIVPLENPIIQPLINQVLTLESFDSAIQSAKQNTLERMAEEHLKIFKEIHHG